MNMRTTRRLCLGALLAVATVIPLGATTAAYADGNGAQTIDCSLIDPALGGTIVFNPSGNLLGNCHEHVQGGGGEGSTGGGATIVDCDEALAPGTVGIQVITPSGGVYTNCHVHVNGS